MRVALYIASRLAERPDAKVRGALVYPVCGTAPEHRAPLSLELAGHHPRDLELFLVPWEVGEGRLAEGTRDVLSCLDRLRRVPREEPGVSLADGGPGVRTG